MVRLTSLKWYKLKFRLSTVSDAVKFNEQDAIHTQADIDEFNEALDAYPNNEV